MDSLPRLSRVALCTFEWVTRSLVSFTDVLAADHPFCATSRRPQVVTHGEHRLGHHGTYPAHMLLAAGPLATGIPVDSGLAHITTLRGGNVPSGGLRSS